MHWAYKATPKKADVIDTTLLAKKKGFICRCAFEKKARPGADKVHDVRVGDTMDVYFILRVKGARAIGRFEVIAPADHPHGEFFGEAVEGTALHVVEDAGFAGHLESLGDYTLDPKMEKFTGWLVRPLVDAPDPYDPTLFPGQATLRTREPAA